MKLIKVVEKLRAEGHTVTTKKRTDGGIKITSIDGVKFSGIKGNTTARAMSGEKLSTQQLAQRRGNWYEVYSQKTVVKTDKGGTRIYEAGEIKKVATTGAKRKSKKVKDIELSSDISKQLKKTQRAWNESKLFEKGKGRQTKRIVQKKFRSKIKAGMSVEEAEQETLKELREAEMYAKGYANPENAQSIIDRVNMLNKVRTIDGEHKAQLSEIVSYLRAHKENLKYDDIDVIVAAIYNDTLDANEKIEAIAKVFNLA